ncbi:MAG: glycosyltransferase [Chitinophagales bacterium]
MKKVLIITPGFPENEEDTSCLPYIQDFVLALSEKLGKENIKIICTQYPYHQNNYRWNGIEIFPAGGKNKKGIYYFFTLRRSIKKITALLKLDDYIIHAFWMGEAAFLGSNALKKFSSRLVVTLMGQDVKPGNKTFSFIDFDKTTFVSLSKFQDDIFFQSYHKHADHLIPMPIPVIDPLSLNGERPNDILFVGSFIPVKQPEQFVSIIHELKRDFPNIKATMVGGGYLQDKLERLIVDQNLSGQITIKGNVSRAEVFDLMKRSKLLIHTSSFEGQCLVYTEALAHGMYAMSYNVGRVEPTDKHIVCNTEQEILIAAYKLLNSQLNFDQQLFTPIDEIVDRYIQIYNTTELN